MVGAAIHVLHPKTLWVHLAVSAIVDFTFYLKEGGMMKKACESVGRLSRVSKNRIISSLGVHLPSRRSLLTSL